MKLICSNAARCLREYCAHKTIHEHFKNYHRNGCPVDLRCKTRAERRGYRKNSCVEIPDIEQYMKDHFETFL